MKRRRQIVHQNLYQTPSGTMNHYQLTSLHYMHEVCFLSLLTCNIPTDPFTCTVPSLPQNLSNVKRTYHFTPGKRTRTSSAWKYHTFSALLENAQNILYIYLCWTTWSSRHPKDLRGNTNPEKVYAISVYRKI